MHLKCSLIFCKSHWELSRGRRGNNKGRDFLHKFCFHMSLLRASLCPIWHFLVFYFTNNFVVTKLAEGESGYELHGSSLIAWRRTQCTTHSYYDDDDGDPNQPGEIKRCNWCIDNVAAYENSFPKRLRTPTIWPLSVGTRANNIFHNFQCVQNVESSKFNLFRECFIPAANTVDWQTLKLDNHGKKTQTRKPWKSRYSTFCQTFQVFTKYKN